MATRSGAELINSSVTAGGSEVTLGPYTLSNKIGVGIDGSIVNGATPPASVPLLVTIEWNRASGLAFDGVPIQGSLTANGIIPITNFPIPYTAYSWQIRYTPAPDQNVTLKLRYGTYEP